MRRPRPRTPDAGAGRRVRAAVRWLLAAACCTATAGCDSTPSLPTIRPSAEQDPRLAAIEFGLVSLGEAPWDGFTMPVVAGDGSAIAVQEDSVPDWSVRLGTADSSPAGCGSVALHAITPGGLRPAVPTAPRLLLGRCWIDGPSGGVLVEQPQDGGGRRLGVLSSVDGSVQWLLDDGATNTRAWVEPDGDRIVIGWCRRAAGTRSWSVDQAAFDRRSGAWMPCADGAGPAVGAVEGVSWGGPCMADGLLTAVQVRDGVLRLLAFDASPARTEPALVRSSVLSMRGTREAAWQCIDALGPTCRVDDRIAFLHPKFGRLATWAPRTEDAPTLLPEGTAGLLRCGEYCLWSTGDRVWACRGPAPDPARRVLVAEGTWILLHAAPGSALLGRPHGRALRIFRVNFMTQTGS
ncbi:MAG: hypothetical protein ACO3DS_07205 [Phycisphaerales bacterium]